jgi:hypothetical protein
VLDKADIHGDKEYKMFDHGFGPELHKFLNPLRNHTAKSGDKGFHFVLVTATITKVLSNVSSNDYGNFSTIETEITMLRVEVLCLQT